MWMLVLLACKGDPDPPAGSVTVELTPAEATVRPGFSTEFTGYVRGTSRWDTATCEVNGGTCQLHFVVAQQYRVIFQAPLVGGDVTLTLAHDGGGGAPDAEPVPASASATIHVEGAPPPPPGIAIAWHDGTNGVFDVDAAFSQDGERFVVLDGHTMTFTYDWASGATLDAWPMPGGTLAYAADDTQLLVGEERHVVRYDPATGVETGRVALVLPGEDDLNHLLTTAVNDVACSPVAPVCAAVRGPVGENCAGCPARSAGLFLIDGSGGDDTLAARRIADTGGLDLPWTRVAWSPDGSYLAVYNAGNEQVEVRNPTGGLLGALATDIPDNTARRDTLLWPEADTIVTETGRWSIATGERSGDGVSLGPGEATWNDGERYAAPNADGQFLLVTDGAPTVRTTTGLAGTVEGVVVAREAPYLAFVAQRQFAPAPELYVLEPATGEPAAVLTAALRASFDLCADGTVVYAAPEGGVAVAAPPSFSPTALAVDGETLEGPFAILPDTGATCRFIAQTGLERSAVIDARTGDVLLQLPFAARAGDATLTRFLEAGTVFAPASRIVDAQRNLVANLDGVMTGWCDEPRTGRFCGVDDTGLLHRWDWAGNDETVRISDRGDVLLPRQLWGELVFWRGTGTAAGQLHFFADGQRRVMDVSLGTFPFLSVATLPDDDLLLLLGARAIRALDGAAVRTRLAESTSEPYP